ncbi:MAG: DUF371 domain-containing protein [Mycobacteriales bacterium]
MTVRLVASGHPEVTGRHRKTLEITSDASITARASCIVGTAASPLPGGLVALRGPVRLELAVGDLVAVVEGEANPYYASTSRLVVRRSEVLDSDTFLVNASAAAADLDRALVHRLRDPAARLQVTATEVGSPAPVLLVLTGEVPAPPAVLAAQVGHVVDLGGPAVRLGGRRHRRVPDPARLAGARTVAVLAEAPDAVSGAVRERLAAALPGARVLVWPPAGPGVDLLLAASAPASPVLLAGRLPATGRDLRAMAALISAAPAATLTIDAASIAPTPAVTAGPSPAGVAGTAAGSTGAGGAAVAGSPAPATEGRAPGTGRRPARAVRGTGPALVLDDLRRRLPDHVLLVPDRAIGWGVGAVEVAPGEPLEPARLAGLRRAPAVAFARRRDAPTPFTVDPGGLARALRGAGVSGRSATAVLTALGLPRGEAYRLAAEQP